MEIDKLNRYVQDSLETKKKSFQNIAAQVIEAGEKIKTCLFGGNKVLICGNGGSAADAQHLAAEIVCRFEKSRPGFPALCLSANTSVLTSWSNDYHFDTVFARQVEVFGQSGDLLIPISTSGNSPNIIKATEQAKNQDVFTIGLLGREGGQMKGLVDLPIVIPAQRTAFIQECHLMVYHFWCEMLERGLDKNADQEK